MVQAFDVIIIGGGIIGCTTAFELAKKGVNVALLEKGSIGDGGTGKSSAIVRQHYSNELTARMAKYGLHVFQNFEEEVGGESGFTNTGFMVLVSEKDFAGLEANVAMLKRLGINTEILDREQIKEKMPHLVTDDIIGAAYEPESGYADPYLTVTSYAAAAKREGAKLFLDTPVTGIRFEEGKVVGVDTPKGQFDAPIVVNATGAWGAKVARMAGLDMPINACRIQVAVMRRPEAHRESHPVVADFIHATYFRDETGALTLLGLIDPAEAEAVVDPDNFKEYLDDDFLLEVGEPIIKRFPILENGEDRGGYASLYAITPDWHPIIDELPAGSGFYMCSGFSGHGFKLAPAMGLMVADMVTGKEDPLFDPSLFRFSRYAEGDEVRGQHEYSIIG